MGVAGEATVGENHRMPQQMQPLGPGQVEARPELREAGILALVAFFPLERREGAAALVPSEVLRNRLFAACALTVLLMSAIFFAALLYLPQFLEKILGFQDFLDRVESDRYRKMITSPEMFEEYLPFAMALGVEGKWARAFEDIYTEPPQWYVGPHGHAFRPGLFVNDLSSMATHAGTAMVSQPRSSGGSGFSGGGGGGGFSGGGFGGGGGGGF